MLLFQRLQCVYALVLSHTKQILHRLGIERFQNAHECVFKLTLFLFYFHME